MSPDGAFVSSNARSVKFPDAGESPNWLGVTEYAQPAGVYDDWKTVDPSDPPASSVPVSGVLETFPLPHEDASNTATLEAKNHACDECIVSPYSTPRCLPIVLAIKQRCELSSTLSFSKMSTRSRDVTPNGRFELISVYKDEWGDFSIDERRWRLTDLNDNRLLGRWTHEDDDDIASVRFGPRSDRVIITMPDATTKHLLLPEAAGGELEEDPRSHDTVLVVGYLERVALSYAPLTGKHELVPHREGPNAGFFQSVGAGFCGVYASADGPVYFHGAARSVVDAHVTAEVTLGEHENRFVLRRGDHVIDDFAYPRVPRSSWGYDNWSADEESADFFMWLARSNLRSILGDDGAR
jgi:hypothetical protein